MGFIRQRLMRRIGAEPILGRLRALWENDFEETIRNTDAQDAAPVPERPGNGCRWSDIVLYLPEVVEDVDVRTINGTAKDALDYVDQQRTGLTVIAIGGDKLSRGLTLEGLCVSYFLRASRMYDTLMQMGRWFGYRPGYLDLCRLYTTSDLTRWFGHITDAAEELRSEFEQMAAGGGTPRDYGLKVQSHPVLMVTSRMKMRTARTLLLSFSGTLVETVALYRTKPELSQNLSAARDLLRALGRPTETSPERRRLGRHERWKGSFLWRDVQTPEVLDFLGRYRTHPDALKVDVALLSEFIRKMLAHGELKRWNVAVIGGGTGARRELCQDVQVAMLKRTLKGERHENRYSIGRLMSPRDESIDLDEAEWRAALDETRAAAGGRTGSPAAPSGPAIRRVRGFGGAEFRPAPNAGCSFSTCWTRRRPTPGFQAIRLRWWQWRSAFRAATRERRSNTR